jgi:Ca-activated chloride channel homolog
MLSVGYPWLALSLPLPFLLYWLLPPHTERRPSVQVPFFGRLVALTAQPPRADTVIGRRSIGRMMVVCVSWGLAIAALTRPQWIEAPIHRDTPARDLLLLVDLSGSMDTVDFTNTSGTKIDRLSAVKQVLGDFLTRRKGDRVGVVVFGSSAFTLVPFTSDLELCRTLLGETQVGMAGPRTVFGDAIGLGVNMFATSTVSAKTIIALTDGNDTASSVPPAQAALIAKDHGIVIYTVAIGDPTAAGEDKLDEGALREVASATGGGYYRALDRDGLARIYDRLDTIVTRKVDTVTFNPRTELFWLPLVALTLLSMLAQAARLVRWPWQRAVAASV